MDVRNTPQLESSEGSIIFQNVWKRFADDAELKTLKVPVPLCLDSFRPLVVPVVILDECRGDKGSTHVDDG